MTVTIEKMVEEGDIPNKVAKKLEKMWIKNADELYCHIKLALEPNTPEETAQLYSEMLDVPVERLGEYMNYIKPYVSDHVLNPEQPGKRQMGCMVDEDRLEEMARNCRAFDDPMEHENAKRQIEIGGLFDVPSLKEMYFKDFETNHEFRDWVLNGQPYHGYEPEAKQQEMVEKQRKLSDEYSERIAKK